MLTSFLLKKKGSFLSYLLTSAFLLESTVALAADAEMIHNSIAISTLFEKRDAVQEWPQFLVRAKDNVYLLANGSWKNGSVTSKTVLDLKQNFKIRYKMHCGTDRNKSDGLFVFFQADPNGIVSFTKNNNMIRKSLHFMYPTWSGWGKYTKIFPQSTEQASIPGYAEVSKNFAVAPTPDSWCEVMITWDAKTYTLKHYIKDYSTPDNINMKDEDLENDVYLTHTLPLGADYANKYFGGASSVRLGFASVSGDAPAFQAIAIRAEDIRTESPLRFDNNDAMSQPESDDTSSNSDHSDSNDAMSQPKSDDTSSNRDHSDSNDAMSQPESDDTGSNRDHSDSNDAMSQPESDDTGSNSDHSDSNEVMSQPKSDDTSSNRDHSDSNDAVGGAEPENTPPSEG